jgi:UDP-glucose 4-epimerase
VIEMIKTLLITGSTGFIGKNIVEAFKDKYDLLTPTHSELDLLNQNDVCDYFENNDIDTVIHCASTGVIKRISPLPGQTLETNLRMFFNLAENRTRYRKLINLGSGAEYNKYCNLYNVKETEFGSTVPPDEYGFSKYIISKYIEKTNNMYSLRLFGIFGKYEDYEFRFISNAIVKNLFRLPITIRQNAQFSWLYIDDLIKILDYFLTRTPHYSSYNLVPSVSTDLITLAQKINSFSKYKSKIIIENVGHNFTYTGDNTRLKEFIGEVPTTPLDLSLMNMIDYYYEILSTIDKKAIEKDVYGAQCTIRKAT